MLLHIPAVIWGAVIEFKGFICPLTPLENHLRKSAGEVGYDGSFVEQYLIPIIYPANLTSELQVILGGLVILVNVTIYAYVVYQRLLKKSGH